MGKKNNNPVIHRPRTESEFRELNRRLNARGYVALDVLKPGRVRDISLAVADAAGSEAKDMAAGMGCGAFSNGPLMKVAWDFDGRKDTVVQVSQKVGDKTEPLGLGYVKWGAGNNIPSVIPPLAMSSPYTAAPLRYIADLTTGLGPQLTYTFPDGKRVEFGKAGDRLREELEAIEQEEQQASPEGVDVTLYRNNETTTADPRESPRHRRAREAYEQWQRVWLGHKEENDLGIEDDIPGVKQFLEENNLSLHMSQCMQDNAPLDIYFPTVGFHNQGYRRSWRPVISRVGMLPAHSVRLEKQNEHRQINHVYFSDSFRRIGIGGVSVAGATSADPEPQKIVMYRAAMPQNLLRELRYIVQEGQKQRIRQRPMWVVCPTFYPSLNKPYYPQPAWWSVFTSKAFDFAATILYDKYKQRDNATSFSKIYYLSLDYLNLVFADMGIEGDKDKQDAFIEELDRNLEQFLQRRENNGKAMRQFMWQDPQSGKEVHNIEIVDVSTATRDSVVAGKEELELSTSPIFLALQVDPRLVGVPMVAASNGGTALREMHLLKQQQLSVHQRLYVSLLNAILQFNEWDCGGRASFIVRQQTLTTLDRSKSGLVDTVANEEA